MGMVNQQPGLTKQVLAASLILVRVQQKGNKLRHQPRRSVDLALPSIATHALQSCGRLLLQAMIRKATMLGIVSWICNQCIRSCTVSSVYILQRQLVHDSTGQHLQLCLKPSCIYVTMDTCGLQRNYVV